MKSIPQLEQGIATHVVQPSARGMEALGFAASSLAEAGQTLQQTAQGEGGSGSESLGQSAQELAKAQQAVGEAVVYLAQAGEKLRILAEKWGISINPQSPGSASAPAAPETRASASAEFHDEPSLFQDRVLTLEQEAAAGKFGKPIKFLSSTEIEFAFFAHERAEELIDAHPPGPMAGGGRFTAIIPNKDQEFPTPEEQAARAEQLRAEAREYVAALTPANAEEAEKQAAWLANVDTLTPADLVNFALYREFAQPTLGATAPPKGATHEEMQAYGERNGWLEFRFGSGTFQEGYYDNPDVCEMRLAPCAPHELAEREEIIKQRAADLALEQGLVYKDIGAHLNVSVYTPEPAEDGAEPSWTPAIGLDVERQAQTLDVVSGLSAAIEDGVWMHETRVQDRFAFGPVSSSEVPVSQVRDAIRVLDGYVELRNKMLSTSTAHGLTWMMAGMTYGVEHGAEAISAEPERTAPTVEPKLQPVRTETFDKNKDLQLQRMLEQARPAPHGGFQVKLDHLSDRGEKFAESLGLSLEGDEAMVFAELFMTSLDVDETGRLSIQPAVFLHVYKEELGVNREKLDSAVKRIGFGPLYRASQQALERNAVQLVETSHITARPKPPGLEPDQWQERWQASPIMNRAYGEQTAAYAQHLRDVGTEHYEPIDLIDPVSVEAARQELLKRRNQ